MLWQPNSTTSRLLMGSQGRVSNQLWVRKPQLFVWHAREFFGQTSSTVCYIRSSEETELAVNLDTATHTQITQDDDLFLGENNRPNHR